MTSIEQRTEELLAEYTAREFSKGNEIGPWLRQQAAGDARSEARRLRHWDHVSIRPAADREGQPAAELLFYASGNGAGHVSVIPVTDTELDALAGQIGHYLNAKAIAAAEAGAS